MMIVRRMMGRWITTLLLLECIVMAAGAADVYPVFVYKEGVGLHFSWISGGKGRAYVDEGSSDCVLLLARTVEDNGNYVAVSNAGWALVSGNTCYGFFPYDGKHYGVNNTALPVTYKGQRQSGNGSTQHLGVYDYMTARDLITTTSAQFNFSHLGCVMRLQYTVTEAMSVNSITLKTTGEGFITGATVNVPEQTMKPVEKNTLMTLVTDELELEKGQTLTAYLMMCPADLSNETLTVRINADDGTFVERQLTGVAFQAGKLYDVSLDDDIAEAKSGAGEMWSESNGKRGGAYLETDAEAVSSQRCYAPDFVTAVLEDGELGKNERLLGDVNADGKVDLTDAQLLTNYNVGVRPVEIDLSVADINRDGKITMADANGIVNITLSKN